MNGEQIPQWVFNLAILIISALVGIVWKSSANRIEKLEGALEKSKGETQVAIKAIEDKVSKMREANAKTDTKLGSIEKQMDKIPTGDDLARRFNEAKTEIKGEISKEIEHLITIITRNKIMGLQPPLGDYLGTSDDMSLSNFDDPAPNLPSLD